MAAAIDLEKAIKTLSPARVEARRNNTSDGDVMPNEELAELWAATGKLFVQAESPDRGANAYMKAGELLIQDGQPEKAQQYLNSVFETFKATEKDVYAVDIGRKLLKTYLNNRRFASAMKLMGDMMTRFTSLKQPHNVHKMVLSRIVLLLVEGELDTAQKELDSAFSLEGFLDSNEAEAGEKLLAAYQDGKEDEVSEITKGNAFKFLDPVISKVAKEAISPTGINESTSAEPANEQERASCAIEPTQGQGDDLGLGGTVRYFGPAKGSAASEAYNAQKKVQEEDAGTYGMTAEENDQARSELFAVKNTGVSEPQEQETSAETASDGDEREGADEAADSEEAEDEEDLM